MAFDFESFGGKHRGEFFASGINVGRVAECFGDDIGGFEADGELVAEAGDIGGVEKRRKTRNVGAGSEIEVALTVVGVFKFLYGACSGADGSPANTVFPGDDNAAADVFCVRENIRK